MVVVMAVVVVVVVAVLLAHAVSGRCMMLSAHSVVVRPACPSSRVVTAPSIAASALNNSAPVVVVVRPTTRLVTNLAETYADVPIN